MVCLASELDLGSHMFIQPLCFHVFHVVLLILAAQQESVYCTSARNVCEVQLVFWLETAPGQSSFSCFHFPAVKLHFAQCLLHCLSVLMLPTHPHHLSCQKLEVFQVRACSCWLFVQQLTSAGKCYICAEESWVMWLLLACTEVCEDWFWSWDHKESNASDFSSVLRTNLCRA